jgi:hypothetical protein
MTHPVYLEPSKRVIYLSVVIPANDSLTPAFPCRSMILKGIIMPDAWTAANISFQASGGQGVDGPFRNVVDDSGSDVVVVASSGRHIVLQGPTQERLTGVDTLKIRSGAPGASVTQTAARELILVFGASTK